MPVLRWTATMDQQLAELWRAGESDEVIAVALGKTEKSVKSRANRMGLGVRDRALRRLPTVDGVLPWTAEEDVEIGRLRRSGMSTRAIATALGRSITGIVSRERKLSDDARSSKKGRGIKECMATGCTTHFMSEGLGHRLCNRCNLDAGYNRSQYD